MTYDGPDQKAMQACAGQLLDHMCQTPGPAQCFPALKIFLLITFSLLARFHVVNNVLQHSPTGSPAENVTVLQNSRGSGLCVRRCHGYPLKNKTVF